MINQAEKTELVYRIVDHLATSGKSSIQKNIAVPGATQDSALPTSLLNKRVRRIVGILAVLTVVIVAVSSALVPVSAMQRRYYRES